MATLAAERAGFALSLASWSRRANGRCEANGFEGTTARLWTVMWGTTWNNMMEY